MSEIQDTDFENLGGGPQRILIQPGIYPARFLTRKSDRRRKDWGEKLIFEWEVYLNATKTQSKRLSRYYNANRDKAGRFNFGDGHDYRADWIRANGGKHPLVWNRLPITIFEAGEFLVEVVTVTRDWRRPLEPTFHHSKIDRIIRPVNDGEIFLKLPVQLPELIDEMG